MGSPTYRLNSSLSPEAKGTIFTGETAPRWLRFGGRKNSTMDNRWFWDKHIETLEVGKSAETDFSIITRIS